MARAEPSEAEIREWCVDCVRRMLDNPAIAVEPGIAFPQMGLDSASSAYFIVELEDWLGRELDPEILVEHQTIADLAGYLVGRRDG